MSTLLIIAIILVVLWALGFRFFRGLGWLINLILTIAIILFIIWLLQSVFHLF